MLLLIDFYEKNKTLIIKNISQIVQSWYFCLYSQTCVQQPPLGHEKCGRYAESSLKKISGK